MNQNTLWYKHIYGPIRAKVEKWIWYDDNQPKSNYFENREEHDAFRSKYGFLREFIKGDNIEKLLPANESAVQHLSVLIGFGMGRGNAFCYHI